MAAMMPNANHQWDFSRDINRRRFKQRPLGKVVVATELATKVKGFFARNIKFCLYVVSNSE